MRLKWGTTLIVFPLLCSTSLVNAQVCEPSADGAQCVPQACSAIPEEMCTPQTIHLDIHTGALTVDGCHCLDFNLCHIEFGNASPFAVGGCPDGGTCQVVAQDADNDGIPDTFGAACSADPPVGACCFDFDDGPVPFDTCLDLTQQECDAEGGVFSGTNAACSVTRACCLTFAGVQLCADLNPFCCIVSGGQPQGPNSACGDPNTPDPCGSGGCGPNGAPCPAGQFCMFPIGACGGSDGQCVDIPQTCPQVLDPVCGCDGMTYGNACEAQMAGVSILHDGPCEVGACCLDIDDGPVAYDSCVSATVDACAAEGGVFGGFNVGCDATEACCINTPFGPDICVDLHPFCCLISGGVPQGANTSCQDTPIPETCGGIAGIQCPPGYECVDNPNDNCDPNSGSDCAGVCVPEHIFCNSADGTTCPAGFICADDPSDNCEPVAGALCPGICVPQPPACGEVCGGFMGIPCDDASEFCKLPIGACCCDHFGMCTPLPNGCPDVWDPVCGCDGQTYGNVCEADAVQVPIAHLGECGQPCVDDSNCAPDQFCRFPNGTCGAVNVPGECMTKPDNCPAVYDPVCGCDGNTYGNKCEAAAAGVSVQHEGPCETACASNADCSSADQFCKIPIGGCLDPNVSGVCLPRPEECDPADTQPVCGCNGDTYGNECQADMAGVPVLHLGPCGSPCASNADCDATSEYCKFPPGVCNAPNLLGVCTPRPETCPEIYNPVCGCDGQTYDNECFAAMAGVSIAHAGECQPGGCSATRRFSNNSDTAPWYCDGVPQHVLIELTPPANSSSLALEDAPPPGWQVVQISHNGTFDEANGKVKWGPFFAPFPAHVSYVVVPTDASVVACFAGQVSIDGINEAICGAECLGHNCPNFMAADTPQPPCAACPLGDCTTCNNGCRNGSISLCEVIGYACAWKVGCNDDLAGVTRAAFIWRNGECYCWNEGEGNWFSTDCPPPGNGLCSDAGGSGNPQLNSSGTGNVRAHFDRRLSRSVSRIHQGVLLSLDVEAPEGTLAMGLEVELPGRWYPISINEAGEWDAVHRKVKWGPFTGELPQVLKVTLSQRAARVKSVRGDGSGAQWLRDNITGSVSFDGLVIPIPFD